MTLDLQRGPEIRAGRQTGSGSAAKARRRNCGFDGPRARRPTPSDGRTVPAPVTEVVKKRWGEGIGGNVIIGLWTVVVLIPLVVLFIVAIGATHRHSGPRDALIVAFVVCMAALFGFNSVIRQTFAVALYRYAEDGQTPAQYSQADLESPFGKQRRLFG